MKHLAYVSLLIVLAGGMLARAAAEDTPVQPPQFMPAKPTLLHKVQPDGTPIQVHLRGDERYHWFETADGYSVQLNEKTGFWEYLKLDGTGGFQMTGLIVGRDDPARAGLTPKLREDRRVIQAKRALEMVPLRDRVAGQVRPSAYPPLPPGGTLPVLVIPANFSNTTTQVTTAEFEDFFNAPTNSVSAYFREVSYNQVNVVATVTQWVTVGSTRNALGPYNTTGTQTLLRRAIDQLWLLGYDQTFFQQFDLDGDGILESVILIHQGQGEEETGDANDLWSGSFRLGTRFNPQPYDVDTSSSTPGAAGLSVLEFICIPELQENDTFFPPQLEIITLGVCVHEMGHAFGLPDLYDVTYSSSGVGDWCLMGFGAWLGVDRDGDSPAHPSAWCKEYLGWVRSEVITARAIGKSLANVEHNPVILRINQGPDPTRSEERLLLENRQLFGFDRALPNFGMLVWRIDGTYISMTIDQNIVNADPSHYGVTLLQADGQWDLERGLNTGDLTDPFPGWVPVRQLGPTSDYDGSFSLPDTNSYYQGDMNIWIENISDPLDPMTLDIRFFPNLSFLSTSNINLTLADPTRPPVTFRNGSQRTLFRPGDSLNYYLHILNRDDNFPRTRHCENAGAFNMEFWASRTGGLTLDHMIATTVRATSAPANNQTAYSGVASLTSAPDGVYSLTVTLDRLNEVRESAERDNLWPSGRQKILLIRPNTDADIIVQNFSFGPNWAARGDALQLGGQVINQGTAATGPFWIEFWGSFDRPDKPYPTLDFFLCDSIPVPNLAPGQSVSLAGYARTRYRIPTHDMLQKFTVVCFADRNDQVNEQIETNNYQTVGPLYFSTTTGARLASAQTLAAAPAPEPEPAPRAPVPVIPAQSELPELAIRVTTVTATGQPAPNDLMIHLTVKNWTMTTATQSVARVAVSNDMTISPDDFFWVSDIAVPLLPPLEEFSTQIPVTAPNVPQGLYRVLSQCDVNNQVAEVSETNNVFYAGPAIVGVDLAFDFFTYTELHDAQVSNFNVRFSEPGTSMTVAVRVFNRGLWPVTNYYWLEFWGSRNGGFSLDEFLSDSRIMPPMGPLAIFDYMDTKKIWSVPDGRYTVMAVADRPNAVGEVFENNNRIAVAGKRLLELRPIRNMNLALYNFRFAPDPVRRGDWIKFNGTVVNDSGEYSGPFWIEFWASRSTFPQLDFQICDSIYIETLRPGQQVFLQPYQRRLYRDIPAGRFDVICIVDRPDNISEDDESDNYDVQFNVDILW
ncbi:MAG: M6 family metalloprotease domain-containing protein [Candidatus Sumerlaeia bacterium]|nr:M6 family metalloprotease domain-containing protein [Candidatus Sumerlaeia bacterium]